MGTRTENTAAGPATLRPDSRDKYAPANLMLYRVSLTVLRTMMDEGVFTEGEYRRARAILNKKYGLSSASIFAETA